VVVHGSDTAAGQLDLMFLGFISFVLVADRLRMCWQPLTGWATSMDARQA
jgi:hypothetical protein